MHVISEKPLRDFWTRDPVAKTPLQAWLRVAEQAAWEKFADIRAVYADADQVGKFTVFNIGGNKYRLIVVVHFNRGKLYIRHVLTHSEYDKGEWKKEPPGERPKKDNPSHGKKPPRPRRPRR